MTERASYFHDKMWRLCTCASMPATPRDPCNLLLPPDSKRHASLNSLQHDDCNAHLLLACCSLLHSASHSSARRTESHKESRTTSAVIRQECAGSDILVISERHEILGGIRAHLR
jgi:hypothetical protein